MAHRLLFWLLLPVTALQGLWLKRIATRLPGAAGERRGVVGEGPPTHLLAVGDSIIDGVGTGTMTRSLPVQFAAELAAADSRAVHWTVEGLSGRDIGDVIDCLRSIESPASPDVVLVSAGVNDVTGLSSTRNWRKRVRELAEITGQRWPQARLLFAGLPPMALFPLPPQPLRFSLGLRAAAFDRIARQVLEGYPNALHVPTEVNPREHDFCEDGYHPSADSCTLWARKLAGIELGRDLP